MREFSGAVRASSLAAVVFLTACSSYSPQPQQTPQAVPEPPSRPVTPAQPPRQAEPVVSAHHSLMEQAKDATERGDYDSALALLERAQRIDPDDAEVYLNLARTHSARGDDAMARASAERGLLYCTSDAQCRALRVYSSS